MTNVAPHPATELPPPDRAEYYNIVATLALADGEVAPEERAKITRLGEVLGLSEAVRRAQLHALGQGKTAGKVTREAIIRIRDRPLLRACLLMDAIVIAFSDRKLMASESRQLGLLAAGLEIPREEAVEIAGIVEGILFGAGGEGEKRLAAQFGETLPGAPQWLRRVRGTHDVVAP